MSKITSLPVLLLLLACSVNDKSFTIEFLPSPAGNNAGEPYLFTDPAGDVLLSWIETNDTIHQLRYSRWNGQQWNEPVTIASSSNWFVNWADYPMIVSNGRENLMAAFLEKSSDEKFSYDVKITASSNGITWGDPTMLHDDGKYAEHGFVSLVPQGDQVFISWLDGRNTVSDKPEQTGHDHHGQMTLRAALLSNKGAKAHEWELDNRVCDCCQTTAAITANGPVVIYRDRSHQEIRDIYIVRWVNGSWTAPKPVYADNWNISGCPVNGPRCEAIGNTLAVAWFTMANDNPAVKVSFSDDAGETFSIPVQLSQSETIGRVDLVLLNESTAVVSWMEGSEIKVATVNRSGQVEAITSIAKSSEARSSGFPQLTKAGAGLLMAWTDSNTKTIRTAALGLK
ncbi:MAG: exo-alpha-sialidase [Flammeovirgaceae bacterium]|nr:MAG: exo-alpha-sialidase [Flammeovirgaceae bacterium]